jgi:hypothetical protein
MTLRQMGALDELYFWDVYNYWNFHVNLSFNVKQIMCPERRESAHCNEHKLVPPDHQLHWCLSSCFWYTIVLQDVGHNQRE